jgi:hypothetical protein
MRFGNAMQAFGDHRRKLAAGNDDTRRAIGDDMADLRTAQQRIDRHENGGSPAGRKDGDTFFDTARQEDRDAVPALDAHLQQRRGKALDSLVEGAIVEFPLAMNQRTPAALGMRDKKVMKKNR